MLLLVHILDPTQLRLCGDIVGAAEEVTIVGFDWAPLYRTIGGGVIEQYRIIRLGESDIRQRCHSQSTSIPAQFQSGFQGLDSTNKYYNFKMCCTMYHTLKRPHFETFSRHFAPYFPNFAPYWPPGPLLRCAYAYLRSLKICKKKTIISGVEYRGHCDPHGWEY